MHAGWSERDPHTITPIAAAFMILAKAMVAVAVPVTVKIPVVGMKFEMHARRSVAAFGMPAIALTIAGDIGRGRQRDRNQRTGARHGAKKGSPDLHITSPQNCVCAPSRMLATDGAKFRS